MRSSQKKPVDLEEVDIGMKGPYHRQKNIIKKEKQQSDRSIDQSMEDNMSNLDRESDE